MKINVKAAKINWAPVVKNMHLLNWRWAGRSVNADMLNAQSQDLIDSLLTSSDSLLGQSRSTGGIAAEILCDNQAELRFDIASVDLDFDALEFALKGTPEWLTILYLWSRIWSNTVDISLDKIAGSKHELVAVGDSVPAKIQSAFNRTQPDALDESATQRLHRLGIPVPSHQKLMKWLEQLRAVDSSWNFFQEDGWTIRKYATFSYDIRYSLVCKQWRLPEPLPSPSTWWNLPPSRFSIMLKDA